MRRFAILFSAMLFILTAVAQERPNRFKIEIQGGTLSGTDDYVISKTATGFQASGTVTLKTSSGQTTLRYKQVLNQDWTIGSYDLMATVNGSPQSVSAIHQGDSINLTASANGQMTPKQLAWAPNTVILDNFVAAQYQILLNQLAAKTPAPTEWQVVVPQRLGSLKSTREMEVAEDSGTLDGKAVALKLYTFNVGGGIIRLWADSANTLMRVSVPLQKFEMTREGFVPAPEKQAPSNCTERDAPFMSGDLKVPATLCVPKSLKPGEKPPVVVMVAGSGPQDRDETIGLNKPLKDVAEGLAANGVATLRFDKRTLFAKQTLSPTLTVDDEIIKDAKAALAAAAQVPETDPKGVFLLGHSLGASMAPYIADGAKDVRGVIMMAGMTVPMDETIERQIAKQLQLVGTPQVEIDQKVGQIKQQFDEIKSGKVPPSQVVFSAPAAYWADILKRDPAEEAKKLTVPMLVLQGGKDIQVVKADYDRLQAALAGKKAEFKWFPDLNHLFMVVQGDSTGAEYAKPNHVAPEVMKAISDWIGQVMVPGKK